MILTTLLIFDLSFRKEEQCIGEYLMTITWATPMKAHVHRMARAQMKTLDAFDSKWVESTYPMTCWD
jgi:hypothetical protein